MLRQIAYASALFLSSACGLIVEIVAGRLIAPYVGMSLYTWTAIIAVVLAGLSVGHWIGGRLAAPHVDSIKGGRRVAIALGLAAVSSLASLVLLRIVATPLLNLDFSPISSIVLLTFVLFFLPSLFVGIVSPILTKLAIDADPQQHGAVIGRMYALGTLGSIVGTLSAGYFFISWIGSTGTVIAVAAIYASMGLAFSFSDSLRALFLASLVAGGISLSWLGEHTHAFTSPCNVESDYFCIRIADYTDQSGRPSALMVIDHLVHSINDRDDPTLLYSPYIHGVDELLKIRFMQKPKDFTPRAFFIGGGGYSLPRAWAIDYKTSNLIVAEIDPKVTRVARDNLWLNTNTPEISIHHRDARALLQALPVDKPFDLIFGDAFHDISIPPHLVTQEFHREIARRLAVDGVYAVNVVDAGANPLFLFSLIKTLKKDFPSVEAWLERNEIGNPGRVTFIVIASAHSTPIEFLASQRGPERVWQRWPDEDLSQRIKNTAPPILSDDYAPVDRLMSQL
jgi:spermidine synthase